MTLFNKYLNGETITVYNELYAMGQESLSPTNFIQTDLILTETFKRVRFNLEIIYAELKKINYKFNAAIKDDFQNPLVPPYSNVDLLLADLNFKIKKAGHLPLSLVYFYKIVGSCNFCWDWESFPKIPWEGADPIEIPPIKDLVNEFIYEDHEDDNVLFAADYLHKDNISGSTYNIQLTPTPSIDSLLLHENWDIPFIEYLRVTFDNCGFSMADQCNYEDLDAFCNRVRPSLKAI